MDNKIFVLASFAKAVYSTRHINYSEDPRINDTSPYAVPTGSLTSADLSYSNLLAAGWEPLDIIPSVFNKYTTSGYISFGMMTDGFYVNQNAAALVMQKGDEIVLAFRGTNDYDANTKDNFFNPLDPEDNNHPDKDQWIQMNLHYEFFEPLSEYLYQYCLDPKNDINKIYITGHSLGGSMAINYLYNNIYFPANIEATTFAAPAFVTGSIWRTDYPEDSRLTQIEIGNDGVPLTWDYENLLGQKNIRPGHRIAIWGSDILESPDDTPIPLFGYPSNSSNHSMDLYLAIAKQIDAATWDEITKHSKTVQLLMGAEKISSSSDPTTFIVDGYSTLLGQHDASKESNKLLIPTFPDPMFPGDNVPIEINFAYGGSGNDIIDFWNSSLPAFIQTTLSGGPGNDTLLGGYSNDTVMGGDGNDSLEGGSGNDHLIGGAGNDIFEWNSALRAGDDTLEGGLGDDTFVVSSNDLVIELDGGGNDTIFSATSNSLQFLSYVENIWLFGTSTATATGNDTANAIKGNEAANRLNGLGGQDSIDGGGGDDTIDGGEGNDAINGGDGNDLMSGSLGNDIFDGASNLRTGADTMKGGAGDDTYVIDSTLDVVVELYKEGTDTVVTGIDLSLEGLEIENVRTFSGFTANLKFTGSAESNVIMGGQGQDTLIGASGNDTLDGGAGPDLLDGGDGTDRLQGGDGADTLFGGSDSDTLLGSEGDDVIDGSNGHDWLEGGAGSDLLSGAAGNDLLQGGDGVDVAIFAGTRGDYAINWTATTAKTVQLNVISSAEGADTLTGIERLCFAAGETYFVSTVDIEVRTWKTTQVLPGFDVSFGTARQATDAAGLARFVSIMESSAAVSATVQPASGGYDEASEAVTLQDAVTILKMIASQPANVNGTPVSHFQSLAADFDGSGTVSLADALGVLRNAAGLQAPAPSWVFVDASDDSRPSILSPGSPSPVSIDLIPSGLVSVNLIGVLRGDVDGSYGVYGG
jgi:Ca2+-binding RTX toxin-like protein